MIERNAMDVALSVDCAVMMIQEQYTQPELRSGAILLSLSTLCYDWAADDIMQNVTPFESTLDDVVMRVIEKSCEYWSTVNEYCKSRWEIELHPLGILFTLRSVLSESDDISMKSIIRGIDLYVSKLEKEIDNDLKSSDNVGIVDIDISDTELIFEYMRLMEEIGTFHKDRDKYDNDTDRELHDKIMAIYNKIIGLQK